MSEPKLVPCTHERHAAAILAIFNDAIVNSTALYDYQPRTAESMVAWFAAKQKGGWPVIGLEDEAGALLGFASYGSFRAYPAYKYTMEHSVYVRGDQRGNGLGPKLMEVLLERARACHKHVVVAAIESGNGASIRLHERLGFITTGQMPQVGTKFGRWLDLTFMQLILTPGAQPPAPHKE